VKVTFTTTPAPANLYAPRNAVVAWVQNQGTFIKTVGQWVQIRQSSLVAWRAVAGNADIDAVISASPADHTAPLTLVWNLRDRNGSVIPDGTYTIRIELASDNSTTQAQNNQGTFTFVKGPSPQTQMGLANGGFTNVSIIYDPNATACGDGLAETPDEKCDFRIAAGMPGACPTTCATVDACAPAELRGVADLCSAECVDGPRITACVNDDGCCADGCSIDQDNDCVGGGPPVANGGCDTGSDTGGVLAFAALGLGLLIRRRRR
jgi:uncharacterized protein (TIGR03382 family)